MRGIFFIMENVRTAAPSVPLPFKKESEHQKIARFDGKHIAGDRVRAELVCGARIVRIKLPCVIGFIRILWISIARLVGFVRARDY